MDFYDLLGENPVIAALKDEHDLKECLRTACKIVFILYGTVTDIEDTVDIIKQSGKTVIVHIDFIAGLSSKDVAVEFIKLRTRADGIISTKPNLVKKALELGLIAIQRTFLVDSIALNSLQNQMELLSPTAVEIMPGIMPQIVRRVKEYSHVPIISSGLLEEKRDVIAALSAGADAVSTTNRKLWYI